MRIVALDPGAARLGWAAMEGGPDELTYLDSGILRCERLVIRKGKQEPYQEYRLRLIENVVDDASSILTRFEPDLLVNETVPPVGGGAFASNGIQGQLAATALTVFQVVAAALGIKVRQIAARTIKKRLTGNADATKVAVRNAVYERFPHLKEEYGKLWVKEHDQSDACGVGVSFLEFELLKL